MEGREGEGGREGGEGEGKEIPAGEVSIFCVLVMMDVCLLFLCLRSLFRLSSADVVAHPVNGSVLRSRIVFHQFASFLLGIRILVYLCRLFFSIWSPRKEFWVGLISIDFACAVAFCLTYSTILLFWLLLYWFINQGMVTYPKFFSDAATYYIFILQISGLVLIVLEMSISVIVIITTNKISQWVNVLPALLGILMIGEAIAFFVIGGLLFQAIGRYSKLVSGVSRYPKQVIFLAAIITTLFIVRACILLVYQVRWNFFKATDPETVYSSIPWWLEFMYYFFLELVPVALMIQFQARLPKRLVEQNFLTSEPIPIDESYDDVSELSFRPGENRSDSFDSFPRHSL